MQTIKNAERTEMQELRKEVTDLKFQLRQAEMQAAKKSSVKANPNAVKAKQVETKHAFTQTNRPGPGKGKASTTGSVLASNTENTGNTEQSVSPSPDGRMPPPTESA